MRSTASVQSRRDLRFEEVLNARGPVRRSLRRARACARRRPLSPATPLHELCFALRHSCLSSRISKCGQYLPFHFSANKWLNESI